MSFVIDPRKNWALAEKMLTDESDPRRRQILATLIAHSKAEAKPDFEALMATVAPNARYVSYTGGEGARANSPKGKEAVGEYYSMIVGAGLNYIEHDVERMAVGRDTLTTEGDMKMAYPGSVLKAMGIEVPDESALYLYLDRLIIVWAFDDAGRVICEDSYSGGDHPRFEDIASRPVQLDQIYIWANDPAA
jgi:hypothetical protein